MYSQLMSPAASPLEMILGLGGLAPTGQPKSGDEFSRMLDFSMPESATTIEGLIAGDNSQALAGIETAGMIMVQIPQSLLESLDPHSETSPRPSTNPVVAGQTEPQLTVPAELLFTSDGSGDTVYLKLQVDTPDIRAGLNSPETDENGREMLLPMRLRTVEQVGDRLIADADLLGAAGKDTSIRLRLELAGNTSGNQGMDRPMLEKIVDQFAAGKPEQMPKMLGDLDVKLIVIENVENRSATTLQSILPEAAPVFKKANGIKFAGQSETAVTEPVLTGETSDCVKVDQTSLVDAKVIDLNRAKTEIDKTFSGETGKRSDFGDRLAALSSNPTVSSDTGLTAVVEGSTAGQESEPGPVRFYDLDHKLDQLKQNPGQKIRIQLSPANLGRMELSIASHRGLVTVNLIVESTHTRQAVERNLAQLENRMAASGIKVDSFHVTVNQSSRGESFAGNYTQQQGGYAGYGQQGGRRQGNSLQNQLRHFEKAGVGFDQVLINCLA